MLCNSEVAAKQEPRKDFLPRPLPAAVVDPKYDTPELVMRSARLVPENAQRINLGKARLGYRHSPRRRWNLASTRLGEIERLIQLRYGGPCDCDDGEFYIILAANIFAAGAVESKRFISGEEGIASIAQARIARWAARWVPLVPREALQRIVDSAITEPRRWRADTAAKLLCLKMAERMEAGITTIGAIDVSKEERAKLRAQRHRERQKVRDTEERRTAGAKTRAEYEGESFAARCRREGISRSTGYRLRKTAACDRLSAQHSKSGDIVEQTTCVTKKPITLAELTGGIGQPIYCPTAADAKSAIKKALAEYCGAPPGSVGSLIAKLTSDQRIFLLSDVSSGKHTISSVVQYLSIALRLDVVPWLRREAELWAALDRRAA